MSGGIDAISAQLRDIEADVLEFSVGVSHGALDEERERNTRILESIEQVTNKLEQTRTPDNRKEMVTAKRLTKTINGNIETLRYLESISCLENIFTDVTKAATIAAVDLSNVTAIKPQVLSTRYLTENVKQCWNYTSRLSELAAVHLKAAADFHEFNHDVNEINCHASRMKKLALNNVETFSPKGTIDEARKLAKELEERLKSWKDLSERSNRLVAKGGSVLPIVNRLLSVKDGVAEDFEADGPIMVQMLMTYVGANFTVNKGDCLPLLNTMESPYLWKVETSTGAQYIPSIACLVVSSNDGQVVDAQASEEKILLGWRDALLNYKKQLAVYYRVYFESICKNNNVKISEGRAQSELMDDLNKLLVHDDVDSGKLACALEVLNSKKQIKKNSGAGVVLTRSDLEELRRPLNELKGHISGIAGAETLSGKAILENNKYLSSGLFEARGMASQLETLRMKHEESHTSMNELYDKIKNWRTVYDNSIQGPKGGVGRLVLSRSAVNVESSSGVSSDEASPIPQLPLPYGRISSFNVAAKFDPLPLTSLPIASDRPRVQKSKVFSGAANIPFPQIETGVNVRIKERSELITGTLFDDVPPKYMRDVATQIMVMQKTMYAQTKLHGDTIDSGQFGSQVETTRVDCMTQIGCVKATKQQQVHSTTITAARKWTDAVHISPEVAEESVHINPKFTTFAVDSTQRIPTQDLMTQINDARFAHRNTVTNEYETRSNEIAGRKLSLCSADLEANKSIRSMTLETSPQLIADSGVQAGIESMSREFETRIQNKMTGYTESSFAPPKQNEFGMQHRPEQSINSFNTTLNQQNILYQPNVQSFQTKNILREDFGFQVSTDVAHDGIQTTNEMLTTNLVGPKMAPPHVHEFQTIPVMQNSQKLQISANVAECENQTEKNTAIGNIAAPKTQEINQCLTNFQMDTISRGSANLQMKAGVIKSENNIKIEMLDGHVNSNNEYPFRVTEECFDHNIKDKTQHGDMSGRASYTYETIKPQSMSAQLVHQLQKQFVDCSTQVGSVLVPETMQVIPVPLTVVDMQTANRLGMKLDAVLCPSKMQLRSMLTEESGINVVEVGTMKQVDVQIGEQMFVGSIDQSFKNRNTRHATIETPKAEVCYLQLLSQGKEPLTPNADTISGLSSSIGHHEVSSMLATAGCSISLRCPEMASCTIGTCPNCYTSISTTEFVTSTSVKQGGRFEMTADQEVGQTEFNRCKNISTSMDRIDFGLNNHDSSVVARSANYGAKVANLQTVGYEFSSKPLPMTAVCNYCKGSGINVETETAQLTQTISLNAGRHPTYQNNQNYHASNMKTAEVQVGTLLKPTSIEIANVNVKTRTAELANQLGINVDSIMCPSNVRMEAELTETAGIQVLGIGDMKDIQVQKGRNLFNADIQTHRPWTKNCSKLSAGPRIEQCTIQNETSSLTLGHAVTDLETADQGRQTTAFAVQNIGCTVTLKNAEICTVCNICNGSGKYIGLGIKSRIMKAAECQVGTVFIPTTMQITNCPIKPRTSELAEQLGMTVDSIMCPSNISMRAELTDQGGIEILDIKDSRNLEVQAGGKMFNADVKTQRAYSSGAISKKAESRMSNLNIRSDGRGVTIGQVSSQLQRFENSNNSTNNECFSLHDIGCEIIFTKASIGTECSLCHGTGKDIGTFSKSSSLLKSTVLSKPTPSVKNKLSVSSGKSIACQVGTILKPVVVQLANINIQTNSPQLMKDLGIQADTVIVPSTVQLESELCETTGIQVKDIKDMKFVELQSGGGAYNADIKSTFSSRTQNSFVSQNAQKRLVNLRGNRLGLTLGTAEKNEKIGDVSSFSKGFTLQDVGCEFVVKCDSKRALCNTCNGSGMSLASFANASQLMNVNNQSNRAIFEKQQLSLRSSQQVSSSVLRDGTSQVHKSCQVGVLLTPSTVHVSKVDLVPTERRSATMVGLPMQAIVCPASIDMHTMLTETSGIRVNDITNMGAVNMDVGGKSYVATVGRNVSPKRNVFEAAGNAETCILEIRGSPKQIEYGMHSTNQSKMTSSQVTGSKYALKNIGCEFRLRDGNMCSSCKTTNSNNLENSKSSNLGSAHKIASSSGKHVACQVGILLIPSVVQVADMQLDLSDSKMSNSLGLKPNAILCPSTVELNSRLTETSGINVMDIREVKEIGIIMGDKTYSADLQGRQKNIRGISANFEKPEQCYLKFETRQSAELIGRHTLFNQTSASIPQTPNKRIDTNAGCTFRIKQVSMEGKAPISSTTINSQSLRPIREKNQHITEKKDNVGCQVGVIMIPNVMEISPAIVTIEDTSSAKLLGVPVGSRMQHTIMGLETRLAEKSGIEIASVNEVDQITVKLGKEKFVARIGDGERSNKTSISLGGVSIGLWNQPNKEMNVHESKLNRDSKRAETSISGKEMLKGVHVSHLASYLIRQISHSSGTVLELHTMTSNGKKIHLRFNEDLRSKLAVSNDRFTGFLSTNSSPRDFCTPTAGSIENRLRALRGEVTLCDVACEALIKPNTFEKKQQTEFSG